MNELFCISNNCFSGFLYKQLGIQYNHPFIWCRINENEILNMLIRWETMDWNKFEMCSDKNRNIPEVNVQDILHITYPHYLYSSSDEIPRTTVLDVNGAINIYYNKPLEYAKEKYISRIARMPRKFPALVIVHDFYTNDCCDDLTLLKIAAFCNYKHIKLFIFSCKRPFLRIPNTEYVRWIDYPTPFPILPKIVESYKEELLSFINS